MVRQFSPSIGGIEDVVLNLARNQRNTFGIDAQVATLNRVFTDPDTVLPAEAEIEGIPVHRVQWWGSSRYPLAPGILQHVMKADLVHVHAIDFFVDFLAITKPLHRRPLIVSTHGGIFHTGRQARLKRLWFNTVTRASLKASDAVVASSQNDAMLFAGLRPPSLKTIENGVDITKLSRSPGAEPLPHRILALGRFTPHKRLGTLFELLASLRRRAPDWTLVVAGIEAGETKNGLEAQAAVCGVADAVRFLVGASDDALAREAALATWFASASAFEGFGVAAVEAVAAGLIPVLSEIPTFARLISTLPAGLLFDPALPEQAAQDLAALDIVYAPRRAEIRRQLAAAVEVFDWRIVTGQFLSLYATLPGSPFNAPAPLRQT